MTNYWRQAAIIYSFIVGLSMLGMWMFFFLAGSIPELETEPYRIAMHLVAEVVTAILLIVSAVGLWRQLHWGMTVWWVSMGMLLYTLIQSPGYFLHTGEQGLVIMFAALGVLSLVIMVGNLPNPVRPSA